jgi:hypothetical protein
VTVDTIVGTADVAVERVKSAVGVGGKAVAGLGLQAENISPAAIRKSVNGFRTPRKNV